MISAIIGAALKNIIGNAKDIAKEKKGSKARKLNIGKMAADIALPGTSAVMGAGIEAAKGAKKGKGHAGETAAAVNEQLSLHNGGSDMIAQAVKKGRANDPKKFINSSTGSAGSAGMTSAGVSDIKDLPTASVTKDSMAGIKASIVNSNLGAK